MIDNLTILEKELRKILKENNKYWNNDKINRSAVINDLKEYNKELINNLINNELIAKNYVLDINGVKVLKIDELISFLRYKKYWQDSYTKYSNKIGLTVDDKFIDYNDDVILDFPFKDCILEGGMSKDDIGKDEIFYNKIIARDEIDTLLSPKILTNVKKYDKDGSKVVDSISEEDNLILKGNNLIALSCLLEKYRDKVKCIYIDPPYNTGSDSFKYNDSFNHSTWLTFMKNRLEIARELLNEDGLIFIQCDDNEYAYLKVLMDAIFDNNNFIANIIYRRRSSQANLSKNISPIHDNIVSYSKSSLGVFNKLKINIDESSYKNPDNDSRGPYVTMPLTNKGGSIYAIITPTGNKIEDEWRVTEANYYKLLNDNRIVFPRKGEGKPRYKLFLKEKQDKGIIPNTIWDDLGDNQQANRELKTIIKNSDFSFPKVESLIKRIIELSTNENDLVLDFFMGSATTQAVAMKMKRRFMGIEQMDYINEVSVPRLQKVMEGEQGGISKEVNWQGGGSFIYAELMEYNNVFVDKIVKANSIDELRNIWNELAKKADLNYKLELKEFEKDLFGKEDNEFNSLSLQEQKEIFIDTLDLNQLYVNYSEIDDEELNVSEEIKKFNKSFYENK